MNNVIDLAKIRREQQDLKSVSAWKKIYLQYSMLELLDTMTIFQNERSNRGSVTNDMIVRGIPLFEIIAENAGTPELYDLARDYSLELRRKLENSF